MDYQELYSKYQDALKLRDLNLDKKFQLLRETFERKILGNISVTSRAEIVPYLAGMKEVFAYVEKESGLINDYRKSLDDFLKNKK